MESQLQNHEPRHDKLDLQLQQQEFKQLQQFKQFQLQQRRRHGAHV